MWISFSVLMVVLVGLCECFHLQNQPRVRRSVCRRAPPCCPGHVCRAYQRFDASRPVAACARSLDSRPLYAPGSQAQQRICGAGSRGLTSIGSRSPGSPRRQPVTRGLRQLRGSLSPGFEMNSGIGQSQTGVRQGGGIRGTGREGNRFGPSSRLSWDQGRTQLPQRFPGQTMQMPGQDVMGQGQMGFPDFPPMPSFGDQLSQPDLFPAGLSPEQSLGGQPNTFASLPGQQGFGQGQRSFGTMDEQRFGLGGSVRGQGQQGFGGQFPSGQSFQSGQRGRGGQASFDQGQVDLRQPQSSFGGQSFDSQSFGSQSMGGRSLGGQSFGRRQSFGAGQSFGGRQTFGGADFGQLPSSAGGGSAPRPFLVEQPPISASSISGVQEQGQGQSGAAQPQQPRT
ncbi:filaggrin-2-like isoform X2 [Mercenaria mercenaria]|uniref:filaggrin-2-like isoform X2 n=1 Tax=Mercenaria mercenaria TaxID=6596 RepID=UPI00234F92B7|nr:filaggrin-2-like isoform X2 [Mercenaria mercenaria]